MAIAEHRALLPTRSTLIRLASWGAAAMAALLLIAVPVDAWAQSTIPSQQVHFPKGSTGTTIKGSLKGRNPDARDYVLGAKAGQTMTVTMQTASTSAYFNVMPPGSSGEAIFAGEMSDQKSWTGTLPADGRYTIRVYLNRAASRQGATANYTLTVSIAGAASNDAKVPGTKYHATGKVPCSMGTAAPGSSQCDFGVVRGGQDKAKVDVTPPGGFKRTLTFAGNKVTASPDAKIKTSKKGDEWTVDVNDYEHYVIPDAVINGG